MKKGILCIACTIIIGFTQSQWIETTQQDFADGIFERNLYASQLNGGTVEFAPRFDLNNDGYIDLFTADAGGPNVKIYWNSASGFFADSVTIFTTPGAANCDAADLDNDGYTDFLVAHRSAPKISIYWGTPDGPQPNFYYDIATISDGRQGIFAADLNKDGYLDITTSQKYVAGCAAIFWGSSSGYDPGNRTDLPSEYGVHSIEVADLDWNGWLDIVFTEYLGSGPGDCSIYWGSNSGYSPANNTRLEGPYGNHGISVADLNRDRWLDLILTGWYGSMSYIYWGSPTGYSSSNQQTLLPGACRGGSSVAYINDDSYMDIVYFRSGGGSNKQKIYWGSDSGYSDNDTTWFGFNLETMGGLIADLNYDSIPDIFSNTYIPGSLSYIFWGPDYEAYSPLPVNHDCHAMFREIGNMYNRRYFEYYISSVHNAGNTVNWSTAEWDDSLPPGTSIDFMVRTGNTPSHDTSWSIWCTLYNGDSIPDSLNSQYIQYMALLRYTNPAYFPCLHEVRISYDSITGIADNELQNVTVNFVISPNPFNTVATITFTAPCHSCPVSMKIFNAEGRCVRTLVNNEYSQGTHEIAWKGMDNMGHALPNGIYFLDATINNEPNINKIIYIR